MILGVDGISDFNALHSGRQNEEVQLCAFDLLAMDGDDLRKLPLSMRKANLERLLARRLDGIFVNPFERGEIRSRLVSGGVPDWFRRAGIETARSALSGGAVKALGEGQKPGTSER